MGTLGTWDFSVLGKYFRDQVLKPTNFREGDTLPETNIFAPENGWLEDEFPFGKAYFQGRTVSFREGNFERRNKGCCIHDNP